MYWLLLIGFIVAHLMIYFAVLRHLDSFKREPVITAYHGIGFAIVFVMATTLLAAGIIGFAQWCGFVALQFIYSVTFLAPWTLARGSYSLQILGQVSQRGSLSRDEILAACETIGAEKKHHRLQNLLTFKLVVSSNDHGLRLSRGGAMMVILLHAIIFLAALRNVG
jgi:hypothetical protein